MSDSLKRRARILVLEALYEAESTDHEPEAVYQRHLAEADRRLAGPGPSAFGREILQGVVARQAEVDGYIAAAADRYPLESLAIVDRVILRLAIWELLSDNSAPVAAVVNEAVELAHRYGGDSSPSFINGVLRTVSTRIQARREREDAAGTHKEAS